jgi:hypothetical protein
MLHDDATRRTMRQCTLWPHRKIAEIDFRTALIFGFMKLAGMQ